MTLHGFGGCKDVISRERDVVDACACEGRDGSRGRGVATFRYVERKPHGLFRIRYRFAVNEAVRVGQFYDAFGVKTEQRSIEQNPGVQLPFGQRLGDMVDANETHASLIVRVVEQIKVTLKRRRIAAAAIGEIDKASIERPQSRNGMFVRPDASLETRCPVCLRTPDRRHRVVDLER